LITFSTQYAPNLKISPEGIQINGTAVLNIMNPLNKEIIAAIIYCHFTSSMTAKMS
jgi:hypothetical protein